MEAVLNTLKVNRNHIMNVLNSFSTEQLHTIPNGLNNNMIWQVGHIVSAQQGLIYGASGNQLHVSPEFVQLFKKGSSPKEWHAFVDIQMVKTALIETQEHLIRDIENRIFENYKEYVTSFGVTLKNVNDAMVFNLGHEMLHFGNIMVMRKLI
jgi:hypothetical protein